MSTTSSPPDSRAVKKARQHKGAQDPRNLLKALADNPRLTGAYQIALGCFRSLDRMQYIDVVNKMASYKSRLNQGKKIRLELTDITKTLRLSCMLSLTLTVKAYRET